MTRGLPRGIFLLTIWLVWAQCPAAGVAEGLGSAIGRAVKGHRLRGARVGVTAFRLGDGEVLYSQNAREKLEIASNVKLFTTAAALWHLGAGFRFRTPLVADGRIADGRLHGNLIIVGGGDPMLSGRMHQGDVLRVPREMAVALKGAGVEEILGDLVLNDRFFDGELRAPGWAEADHLWWYGAPASALSFNDNCVDLAVTGAGTAGETARVKVLPEVDFARVVNRAVTVSRGEREGLFFSRNGRGEYVVSGRIRTGRTRGENLAVEDPPSYFGAALRTELARAGVKLCGRTRMMRPGETFAAEAQTVYAWESPLADAIAVANQRSQNFFAEQILKTLGASKRGVGSRANGIAQVMGFLREAGVAEGSVELTDGCGLSPGNLATPEAVVALLSFMHRSREYELFRDSLAVNGAGMGTMRNRLKEAAAGRIYAKTGSVKSRGVSALSGYAQARGGEWVAFCILVNDAGQENYYAAKMFEDSVCRAILGVPNPARRRK